MGLTAVVVALIALTGLTAATWAAFAGQSAWTRFMFYLGLLVGAWAVVGLLLLGAIALFDITT